MKIAYFTGDRNIRSFEYEHVYFIFDGLAHQMSCPDHVFKPDDSMSGLIGRPPDISVKSIYAYHPRVLVFDSISQMLEFFRVLNPRENKFKAPSLWLREYGHHGSYMAKELADKGFSLDI